MRKFLHAITQKLNNIYLKKKLFLFYTFCAILPVTILGIFLITDTKEKMMDLTDSQITAANQANRNMLMSVTSLTTSIANIIASDEALQTIIATEYDTPNEVYTAYRNFSLLEELNYAVYDAMEEYEVTVAARKEAARKAAGENSIPMEGIKECISSMDYIFNTVPSPVMGRMPS